MPPTVRMDAGTPTPGATCADTGLHPQAPHGRLAGMSDDEQQQPAPRRGKLLEALTRAERGVFTRPAPKSARAQVKFLLTRAKGSTKALAAYLGHYRGPAAREAAASLLTSSILAHVALLAELARLVPGVGVDQLAFAAGLATTEPEAAGALAVFLARARS
ncbi:hypothetical protein [Streptomyces sp. M2CJ-2]|uniref:hypothetical protein n=1 Tax=Streptomyces sp. M2CJ-2 TaxID=2803948 RepID=UPI001F4351DF|nr:hypothetical protein [Streptomyces sp. M2CJ-2]